MCHLNHAPCRARLRDQSGAFDLASIMVGVTVIAIMTLGVIAVVFAVIPWAQDRAAQQDVQAVVTAEAAYYTQDFSGSDRYGTLTELIDFALLSDAADDDGTIVVTQAGNGQTATFTVTVTSDSGNVFTASDNDPEPRLVTP